MANMNMSPHVTTIHYLHYKAQRHAAADKVAKHTMTESPSELLCSLPPCNRVV